MDVLDRKVIKRSVIVIQSLHWKHCLLFGVAIWLLGAIGVWEAWTVEGEAARVELAVSEAIPTPSYPQTHSWLSRPVAVSAAPARPSRFYLYGSTGQGQYQVHHGVEFAGPSGTPVLAAAEGTVVVAGSDEQQLWGRHLAYYGQLVVIRLERAYGTAPVYVLYGHLSRIHVRLGQRVRQGEEIGQVGMSGVALGPHLHFEVRVGRNAFSCTRNPELWLAPVPGHGTIVGRVENEYGQPVPQELVTVHPVEQPDRYWRETWTYPYAPAERIQPDNVWRENFAMGDVPAGEYIIRVRVNGRLYARRAQVDEGQVAWFSVTARPVQDVLDLER